MDCRIDANHRGRMSIKVPPRIELAVTELQQAVEYAKQTSGDQWEFATEISRLTEGCRLTLNDLRWLVRMGFVEHQHEVTSEDALARTFRRSGELIFTDRSCFVLTEPGVLFWLQNCGTPDGNAGSEASSANCDHRTALPHWDPARRVLSVAGTTVKCFKWVAGNQEAILAAFQEEGWPPRIDDPLPPQVQQDPKRRLSDTIKCLNRRHRYPLIHFRGDGTGEGVVWEINQDSARRPSATG